METTRIPILSDIIHTSWCMWAGTASIHPDGAECTKTRTLELTGAKASVTAQGLPFDSQVVKVVDCEITNQIDSLDVVTWLNDTIQEMSEMVHKSLMWEENMMSAHSSRIQALQDEM